MSKVNPQSAKQKFLDRYTASETNQNEELQQLYSRLYELEGTYGKNPVILQGETLVLYNKHLS